MHARVSPRPPLPNAPMPPAGEAAPPAADLPAAGARGGKLFRRYALYLSALLGLALLASGGIGVYAAYRDTRVLVDALQREQARAAAALIGQFLQTVELQLRGALISGRTSDAPDIEARHGELLRLLRISPAISDASWLDSAGHERVRVSRLAPDVIGSDIDRSRDPAVVAARGGAAWYGNVEFRRGSEPHLPLATAGSRPGDGFAIADINLKFASDVVAGIRIGEHGHAYVVDGRGRLILHPDPSRMLRMTSLADSPQVRAALSSPAGPGPAPPTIIARAEGGSKMLAAHAAIERPGWHVIVEQPLTEAFDPLLASVARTAMLLVAGLALAALASLLLARRMTAPIRLLELGARKIGEGRLDERVRIHTGDELEALADQFNRMAGQLSESYASLEEKVAERTRQLEEANRAKARFLAAASHDLRQPVHALGLFVAQLPEARDEESRRKLIGKVTASSAAVSDLIEALLDISKLDAGAVAPQPAEFALQPLFERIEQACSFAASEKELRLRVRPSALRLRTDPMLLERILLNLCGNAIRYTAQGGAILAARVRGSVARIEVRDTGIGITAEQQRHIFEEFYQAAGVTDGTTRGLGLGLAIVDRLARLLDLTISVRSVPGRGSVFALDVPLASPAATCVANAPPPPGAAQFDALPVLLVDDDDAARDAIEGLLAQWGCEVRAASCAADAIRLLADPPRPRLIISDYHLGANDLGTALVQTLRDIAGQAIPAVILTADVSGTLREETAAAGLHLLHKPLNPARLRALLLHVADIGAVD